MLNPYYSTDLGVLYHGDCLDIMPQLEQVDMILTDPPYGTTACKWDSVIPFEPMWEQLKRVIKPNGAIALFGSEPFSSVLRMSNIKNYKYDWIWNKKKPGNFATAKHCPMKIYENIIIFNKHKYYPIMTNRKKVKTRGSFRATDSAPLKYHDGKERIYKKRYPKNIIEISNANQKGKVHPTQKPVALMEYLIKTYTNEGDTILDFAAGSGTTGVACEKLNRRWIGIEIEEEYCEIAAKRIENERKQLKMF